MKTPIWLVTAQWQDYHRRIDPVIGDYCKDRFEYVSVPATSRKQAVAMGERAFPSATSVTVKQIGAM